MKMWLPKEIFCYELLPYLPITDIINSTMLNRESYGIFCEIDWSYLLLRDYNITHKLDSENIYRNIFTFRKTLMIYGGMG